MKTSNYYAFRCAVVETFWGAVAGEKLTLGQAAGRGLVDFRSELAGGGRDALIVLSVVLSRLARYEPSALRRFGPELNTMKEISKKSGCWRGLDAAEKARMREDVQLVLEKSTS